MSSHIGENPKVVFEESQESVTLLRAHQSTRRAIHIAVASVAKSPIASQEECGVDELQEHVEVQVEAREERSATGGPSRVREEHEVNEAKVDRSGLAVKRTEDEQGTCLRAR